MFTPKFWGKHYLTARSLLGSNFCIPSLKLDSSHDQKHEFVGPQKVVFWKGNPLYFREIEVGEILFHLASKLGRWSFPLGDFQAYFQGKWLLVSGSASYKHQQLLEEAGVRTAEFWGRIFHIFSSSLNWTPHHRMILVLVGVITSFITSRGPPCIILVTKGMYVQSQRESTNHRIILVLVIGGRDYIIPKRRQGLYLVYKW